MKLLIDADGCPVVDAAVAVCRRHGVECVILCDTAHVFQKEGAQTITVAKGPDSADFALVNRLCPGDVAVTQDYGLAALCLARLARVLDQNGREYTAQNIDALLLARHTAKKLRRGGARLKGPPPRRPEQDAAFARALEALLAAR